MSQEIVVALVGNPNVGKTALFNYLTGKKQKVGNWAGVTVAKKTGVLSFKNHTFKIIDLPGVYALNSDDKTAMDAKIACEYLLNNKVDVVINLVDAANLERNLYLTCQLMEMQIPMVVGLNMLDVAKKHGVNINAEVLSKKLGCPVVKMQLKKAQGVLELKNILIKKIHIPSIPKYKYAFNKFANVLTKHIKQEDSLKALPHYWLGLGLLENNKLAANYVENNPKIIQVLEKQKQQIQTTYEEDADILLADARYDFINTICSSCKQTFTKKLSITSEKIDKIVLHRIWGLPIFLSVMYLMFEFSINLGGAIQPFFDNISSVIFIEGVQHLSNILGVPNWMSVTLGQGFGLGINTVITFIPQIAALFLFLSLLEESGYMIRAACVMDRIMQSIGLSSRAFVPLIVGFGCNVPAIMATRNLNHKQDILRTIMMTPFMSCGARMTIFAVFATAFFPHHGASVIFGLYIFGILIAIVTGFVFKLILKATNDDHLVLELPEYHMPNVRFICMNTWQRLKKFITRAGKYIVPICILIGVFNHLQLNGTFANNPRNSVLAIAAKKITPVLHPMGIETGNWPATVGLITGVLAKEVVIGTLNTIYTQHQDDVVVSHKFNFLKKLRAAIYDSYSNIVHIQTRGFLNPFLANSKNSHMNRTALGNMVKAFSNIASVFAYMLFILLYIPCVATIAVIAKEAGKAWAVIASVWCVSIAYVSAVVCYQSMTILQHPFSSCIWIMSMLGCIAGIIYLIAKYINRTQMAEV